MNSVTFTSLSLTFEDVTDIIQSEVELNQDGRWVRSIRVLGTSASGVVDEGGAPVLLVLTVIGDAKENVDITTPPLSF